MRPETPGRGGRRGQRMVWGVCLLVALLTAVYPFGRVPRRAEWSYNEGWNLYGAARLMPDVGGPAMLPVTTGRAPLEGVCCQSAFYPAHDGWTTVNYPMLSFALMAGVQRMGGEPLFAARLMSLLALVVMAGLVGMVAWALGVTRRAAWWTAMFCFAVFCVCAVDYVGVDDPQLLADAVFVAGLLVYVSGRPRALGGRRRALEHAQGSDGEIASFASIGAAALLFVVGGCVKQSPIDFPLAVLVDLLLVSRVRALWFCLCGAVFGMVAVVLNTHFGGPWFVRELLLGRGYSVRKAVDVTLSIVGPMVVPMVLAGVVAWQVRREGRRRIAAILLVVGMGVGGYFSGGAGVAGNALFTVLVAMVLLLGLALEDGAGVFRFKGWVDPRMGLPLVCFGWLAVPALVYGVANPVERLRAAAAAERRFAAEVTMLRSRPGPALCESLLRCYAARKPYVYDPFNATRLVGLGRLSPEGLVAELDARRYGAVQMHAAVPEEAHPADDQTAERFPAAVLAAVGRNYRVALRDEDGVVYVAR